jgi:hypothetical protein
VKKALDLQFEVRPALRLSAIEKVLKTTRVIVPCPSRPTLIKLIESGKLKGRKQGNAYLVDELSFHAWVRSVNPEAYDLISPSKPLTG